MPLWNSQENHKHDLSMALSTLRLPSDPTPKSRIKWKFILLMDHFLTRASIRHLPFTGRKKQPLPIYLLSSHFFNELLVINHSICKSIAESNSTICLLLLPAQILFKKPCNTYHAQHKLLTNGLFTNCSSFKGHIQVATRMLPWEIIIP